jgi:hypothetical protein
VTDPSVAFEQLNIADDRWETAIRASAAAPPDPGFAGRLRAIASAAEQEAAAFRLADAAGLAWPVLPEAADLTLSYELRRGGTRRGPDDLWDRFDAAVSDLALALQGVALSAISRAFTMLADVTHTLADEIDQLDSHS